MVTNQTVNLTPDLSFDHNLCFKCPNGLCKPNLNIYTSISFQWYKECFKTMGFDPCNFTLKIWESIWDSNSYNGSSLGSVRVHSLTLFANPRACDVTLRSPSWLATFATPCLGRKPKVRVAIVGALICGTWFSKKQEILAHPHHLSNTKMIMFNHPNTTFPHFSTTM
jgi:hypothetical protein